MRIVARRKAIGWLVLALVIVLGLIWGVRRLSPIPERDYARVGAGMSCADVRAVLGKPDRRYVRSVRTPYPGAYIGCSPPDDYPTPQVEAEAAEVWRWSRCPDQRMGVVFGRERKAIYKWLDY